MTKNTPTPTRAVRLTTILAVLLVATVAAVVSFAHIQDLAHRAGEDWRSWLLPLSVDGLVVAASMTLLTRNRAGLVGGWLPWASLLLAVGASLVANIASADPNITAQIIAAWAPAAFALSFHLMLLQRRPTGVVGAAAKRTNRPAAKQPTTYEPDADADLIARAAAIVKARHPNRPGRRVLAKELGITEWKASKLLAGMNGGGG